MAKREPTRHNSQPMDLAFTPKIYPGHRYLGNGEVITVTVNGERVGQLSRNDSERIGWLPEAGLSPEATTVRLLVESTLRDFAAAGKPLSDAWADILANTQHSMPSRVRLNTLVD